MTKLPVDKKFIDFSDYARLPAVFLVKLLLPTRIGAYTLTFSFLLVGLIAIYLIIVDQCLEWAAFLLIFKSLLDAADGEIARRTNNPSIVGRYMDSIFDFIINLLIFTATAIVFNSPIWFVLLSFILFELQGSVYNYYYLVKRYQVNGDKTSRIFEWTEPEPFSRDNLSLLKISHKLYLILYIWQDKLVHRLDPEALLTKELPSWFLTLVSFLGLGFQLLIIAFMLITKSHDQIFLFFAVPYTIYAILLIFIRRLFVK